MTAFTHEPRAGSTPESHPSQCWFGNSADSLPTVCVIQRDGHPAMAELYTWLREDDSSASFALTLSADEMRELARRLVDAASHLECVTKGGAA